MFESPCGEEVTGRKTTELAAVIEVAAAAAAAVVVVVAAAVAAAAGAEELGKLGEEMTTQGWRKGILEAGSVGTDSSC